MKALHQRELPLFFLKLHLILLDNRAEVTAIGFRNHLFRTFLLLALALGVGIPVAISSGGERTRPVQGNSLPGLEHRADQRLG